eukprot:m.84108 g.84108  ORF g.84108 m.84108 type:complete len:894 (-) comp9580_c0_seq2:177-2858(-)
MDIASQTFTAISNLYSGMNKATLSGAIDVIVVRQPDGSLKCSPFHVRFGKLNVWAPAEKRVKLWINGQKAPVEMKLGPGGEAFFVTEIPPDQPVKKSMITSPITTPKNASHGRISPSFEDAMAAAIASGSAATDSVYAESGGEDADERRDGQDLTPRPSPALPRSVDTGFESADSTPLPSSTDTDDSGGAAVMPTVAVMRTNSGNVDVVPVPATIAHAEAAAATRASVDGSGTTTPEEDPIHSWKWGAIPDSDATARSSAHHDDRARHHHRQRLVSTSSAASDAGMPAPGFQVVNLSKKQLQGLALRAADDTGVELAESLTVGPETRLAEGDGLLSINGIGVDTSELDFVRMIIDAVGTDSVELVLSSGPLPKAATPHWIRQLGRAFRDHSVDGARDASGGKQKQDGVAHHSGDEGDEAGDDVSLATPTTDMPCAPLGHDTSGGDADMALATGAAAAAATTTTTSKTPATVGGVALSLCGTDNVSAFDKHRVSFKTFATNHAVLLANPDLVVMIGGEVYTWESAAPLLLSVAAYGRVPPSANKALSLGADAAASLAAAPEEASSRSWWFFGSRSRRSSPPRTDSSRSSTASDENVAGADATEHYSKSLTLDSDQLKSLGLQPGENEALFCVTSKMQGKAIVQCVVHLWEHDDDVVISDIDGTITRSDIMGHAASLIGRDWTHKGVAGLYTKIHKNGYKFVYLTSRSISHAPLTREYINSVEQDSGVKLPRGPIMFSPDNFLASIHREVIARNPQEFKIACLKSIADLFPRKYGADGQRLPRPFVAGFGNRHTDEEAYAAVDVPPDRVFTIDPSGNLKMGVGLQQSTYVALQERIDLYFPPVDQGRLAKFGLDRSFKGNPSPKKYSNVAYWNTEKNFMTKLNIDDELQAILGPS